MQSHGTSLNDSHMASNPKLKRYFHKHLPICKHATNTTIHLWPQTQQASWAVEAQMLQTISKTNPPDNLMVQHTRL